MTPHLRGVTNHKAKALLFQSFLGFTGERMVLLERESLNSLFETLEEWERHLAHLDLDGLERGHDEH